MSGGKILDQIELELRNFKTQEKITVYIDVDDNSLSRKWLSALNDLLEKQYHLEKNYCFFGFADSDRDGEYILDRVNESISAINNSNIGYHIDDHFCIDNTLLDGPIGTGLPGRKIQQEKFNQLHRYFEDLQGVSGNISDYYHRADATIRWHISQLNLLCHEFESWALSYRKKVEAPQWQRPSQLMCWLRAPRFTLDDEDYELFGIDTIARPTGGVFVGVNKAVGKHHWEVYHDEGRDRRLSELTTTTLKGQTEAAGDFDIEWAADPSQRDFMIDDLARFRQWLVANGFDPDDKSLTIGHPQVGAVDLIRSFGTTDCHKIWSQLSNYLDVWSVKTSDNQTTYDYHWSDNDFSQKQIDILSKGIQK
jgi:hypothetical protein